MTVYAATIVDLALTQSGGEYLWGGKAAASDPNPIARHGLDCSGLIAWAVRRAGGIIPDGSANQWQYCVDRGTAIPVGVAEDTRGALLFEGVAPVHHVVLSLGNGRTIEARGKAYGIGSWPFNDRPWSHGARIPDVAYEQSVPPPPVPPGPDPTGGEPWPGRYLKLATPRMRGDDVRAVQRSLALRGYSLADDGRYGPITVRTVRHFQRVNGLADDGIVGPLTWARLRGNV